MKAFRLFFLTLAVTAAGMVLGGCTTLLPESRHEVVSEWNSYDDAVKGLAAIEPYQATRSEVHGKGLDPRLNPAITVLHFADVLQRFSAGALIDPNDVDRGVRDCLHAGKRCSGYAVAVSKVERVRVGGFWADTFNFKRETVTTGWSVDALLVFVDDLLVYELVGGRPKISEHEVVSNPLGPLQGWGDDMLRFVH